MKLLFIQIGDMHIREHEVSRDTKIERLCDALSTVERADEVFLLVCGDLTEQGIELEFSAARIFIQRTIAEIKRLYTGKYIHFQAVPGNHDLCLNGKKRNAQEIIQLQNNNRDENFHNELKLLNSFFSYANSVKLFNSSLIVDTRIIPQCRVQINLLNTAPFSSTGKDDKRLHHIPHHMIEALKKQDSVDINVAIMHHSTEWFCEDTKYELENALYANCEIVFLGHEHIEANTSFENMFSQGLKIVRSGNFSISGNNAEFNAVVIDTNTLKIAVSHFRWDNEAKIFKSVGALKTDELSKKHPHLYPSRSFLSDFMKGHQKLTATDDLQEYFVFPKLVAWEDAPNRRNTVSSTEEFFSEMKNVSCICIEGAHRTGKTSLLKSLFLDAANRGFTPLFIENTPSLDSRLDKLEKHLFENQYGENGVLYERYKQVDHSKKVIFIDDFDQISHEGVRQKVFSYLSANFAHIVLSTDSNIAADLLDYAKNKICRSDLYILQLQHMYRSMRSQLISKICELKGLEKSEKESVIANINIIVEQASDLFTFSPDFIIKFMSFYLDGGNLSERRGTIFGAIFQSDITRAIQGVTSTENVDIFLAVLDEIAYRMHFSRKADISVSELEQCISNYNEDYSENVNLKHFVQAMCEASILNEGDSLGVYRFQDKNTLAYFVARRMNKDIERVPDKLNDLRVVIRNICFGINGTVVLFLSYLRMNTKLIEHFILEAERLLEGVPELNVDGEDALYLRTPFTRVDTRTIEEKRAEKDRDGEASEQNAMITQVKYKDIYEYNDADADNLRYRIGRAIKCLEIISKSLLSMRGNLQAGEKDAIVERIYRLPNRILYMHFLPYHKEFESFEERVNNLIRKYKGIDIVPANMAKNIILEASWMFILAVYSGVAFNCSDSSSLSALDRFSIANTNHRIQNLIMSETADSTYGFISKSIKLFESNDDVLQKYLVQCVAEIHLIKHKSIKSAEMHRLNSKVFQAKKQSILQKKRGRYSRD